MRTSFHHQPEAQHPNFQLSTSWQADYPIFGARFADSKSDISRGPRSVNSGHRRLRDYQLMDRIRRHRGRVIAFLPRGLSS
jgi:hypothetical protein